MTFRVVLPLPQRDASPNSRCHWSRLQRAKASMRSDAAWLTKAAKPKGWSGTSRVRLEIEFINGKALDARYRPHDEDNAIACVKGYIDGSIDAGVAPNDSSKWLECDRPIIVHDRSRKGEVIFTWTEIE